jgi:SHS2 domain-containing protein
MEAPDRGEELAPGTWLLEHTADMGLELEAGSLEELFRRAATGLRILLAGPATPDASAAPERPATPVPAGVVEHRLELEAEDAAMLLVQWLRELLYLHEVHGFEYESAAFETLDCTRLSGTVRGERGGGRRPLREIKAVTYHGLTAVRDVGIWRARVLFDL